MTRRAVPPGKVADLVFQLGGAHVGGGRVDEVADQRGGVGEAQMALDRGRIGGQQDRAGRGSGSDL